MGALGKRLAGALTGLIFAIPAAAAPAPGGVYTIIGAEFQNQYAITAQALQSPGVDGLLIHLRWNQISTGLEQYDWTMLDNAVQLATTAHKRFEIGIVTGAAMPSWITDASPAGLGAQHATFSFDAVQGQGCTTFTMAAPYDPAYLAAFDDLLRQLAAHLRSTGAFPKLAMLKLDGMTTTTDELRLPAVAGCSSDPVQLWQGLGYTSTKMRAAWNTMLQSYLHYFPQKAFNIGFIGFNAFPGIDAKGRAAATPEIAKAWSSQFGKTLISDASAAMPGRLAVGFDSLTLNPTTNATSYKHYRAKFLVDAAAANVRLGWQTNELLGIYPGGGAACGGADPGDAIACTSAREFRAMLYRGLYPKHQGGTPPSMQGVYLELFPQNIVAYPEAVRAAHRHLSAWTSN